MQFRLNLQRLGNSSGGVHERNQYADVEAKKAPNRNDKAEGAQTEIHRSFANEGTEPTGPRPCRFSPAAVWHVRPAAAGCASSSIGANARSARVALPQSVSTLGGLNLIGHRADVRPHFDRGRMPATRLATSVLAHQRNQFCGFWKSSRNESLLISRSLGRSGPRMEINMSAAIARLLPRASAESVANIDSFVSIALFSGVGLLPSLSVLIADQYIPGEWF